MKKPPSIWLFVRGFSPEALVEFLLEFRVSRVGFFETKIVYLGLRVKIGSKQGFSNFMENRRVKVL